MTAKPTDVDAYLAALPADARAALEGLRRTIKTIVPEAVESIGYGMPTYKYRGRPLIGFAAWKQHCAIYGSVDGSRDELAAYDTDKGTIRFPPDKPLPEALVKTLLDERRAAIDAAASAPKRKKSSA